MKTLRVCLSLLILVWSVPVETWAAPPKNSVSGDYLKDRTVRGRKLRNQAVGSQELADGAVTAEKLDADLLADPNVVWVSTDGSAGGDGT